MPGVHGAMLTERCFKPGVVDVYAHTRRETDIQPLSPQPGAGVIVDSPTG